MSYVDGFVLAVPKAKLDDYKKLANTGGAVWMEHGALAYVECVGDDVPYGETTRSRAPCRPRRTRSSSFPGSSMNREKAAMPSWPR